MVTGLDGTFKLEDFVDVFTDFLREALQNVERKFFKTAVAVGGFADGLADDVVSRTEGNAVTNEVVGKVGCGGETRLAGLEHHVGARFNARHHVAEGAKGILHRVDRVEDRFLVFLEVLVVGKGRALHEREHRNEVAVDATRLAAGGFRNVRVLLLRHDGTPRREAVGKLDEGEALAHPGDEFFRKTRDVHHQNRRGGAEFDREVAVGNGVERILSNGFKTEELGRVFAVDRIGGAGESGGAQRAAVDAAAHVEEAFAVTFEHFDVGEHVVTEGHGLGDLHVGEARHDDVAAALGLGNEHFLEVFNAGDDRVDFAAQIEADVGRDLVVARAARVEALAGVADQSGKAGFDVEVHVFEFKLPLKDALFDFFLDLSHAAADVFEILFRNHADFLEHRGVGERTLNVCEGHALVKIHAGGVAENEGVDGFREAAGPGLLLGVQRVVRKIFFKAHSGSFCLGGGMT